MPIVSERTIEALARRITDMRAKAEAAQREINWAIVRAERETDPGELEDLQIYIEVLSEVYNDTLHRIEAATKTFNKARDSRVTGRLQ